MSVSAAPYSLAALLRWLAAIVGLGVVTGSACALFLVALDGAQWALHHEPRLLWLLPLAGIPIVWLHQRSGPAADGGMTTILSAAEQRPQHRPVPWHMAPLILVSTLMTHFCGGSAGREGTAVQMGGGIAAAWFRVLPASSAEGQRLLLIAGMAAGFAGLFGTPWAASIFALEVAVLGRLRLPALPLCLAGAWISHLTCHAWGVHHAAYPHIFADLTWPLWWQGLWSTQALLTIFAVALACALVARGYGLLHGGIHRLLSRQVPIPMLRPLIGGVLVIALVWLCGSRDYLGLGVTSIDPQAVTVTAAFAEGGAEPWSWAWKMVFTALTLGSGFKGGEVTPLFFIGATLGNSLSMFLTAPLTLLAGLGMMAVFAAASRTPLACAIMGAELFGWATLPWLLPTCYLAAIISARTGPGIYSARQPAIAPAAADETVPR